MGSINQETKFKDLQQSRKLHIGVILMGGETEIIDVAPIDFFHSIGSKFVNENLAPMLPPNTLDQTLDADFHWVNETGEPAKLTAGARVLPTDTFATCPTLDIALIGAHNSTYTMTEGELAYVRKVHTECHSFLFICAGFMPALQAGLLDGKRATGIREMLPQLRKDAPHVQWTEKRWEHDGKVWTSGTLLNGQDMVRAWVEENMNVGEGNLAGVALDLGGWPVRDREYRDVDKATTIQDINVM